ncbi:MAG: type II secretion system F family protein [Planctomycetes bacterium]|nr:type II secretion system F family protein [Planctomycetota bacterium]
MAKFHYIARAADGGQVTGVMEADSEPAVAHALDERRLFPVRISQGMQRRRRFGESVKLREIGVMFAQLADMLAAGIPLLRALDTLSRVGLPRGLTRVVVLVREDVAAGQTLADAMTKHPELFSSLHTAMIRAGERAGFLDEALGRLAGFIERQDELRFKVRGALIYPALLSCFGLVVLTGVLVVLVPKFKPFFTNIQLPTPTLVLFALSDLLVHKLPLALGLVVLAVVAVRSLLRSRLGGTVWDRWQMRIPLVGRVLKMVGITRFCRVLGTMLANGVPILQALAIGKDATGSPVMAAGIERAAESVKGGNTLAGPLKTCAMFPADIVEMIAVAEESNQLAKVLVQIAETVERRTARQVDVAVRLMEPAILVLLALAIGFVAVGLLYPMFIMSQTLQ